MKKKMTAAARSLAAHKANWTRRIARLVGVRHTVRFCVEAVDKGKKAEVEREFHHVASLSFVPTPGMMICAVDGDDFREVETVYYDASEAVPFAICFKFVPHTSSKTLLQIGWKERIEGGPF